MIVVDCPQCSAKFRVPSDAVPPEGRALRCSTCGHKWHYVDPLVATISELQTSLEELPPNENIDRPPDSPSGAADTPAFLSSAPVDDHFSAILHKTSGGAAVAPAGARRWGALARGYLLALVISSAVIWILATNQMVVTTLFPRAQAVYSLFDRPIVIGQPDFTFERVKTHHTLASFTITGAVRNRSSTQKNVWPIRAVLYATGQPEPIAIWVFRPNQNFIDPDQELPFEVTRDFTDGDRAARLELDVMADVAPEKQ